MLPIIEELEGSIERDDMSSQMMILAQNTEVLSEHGMPGDSTEAQLIPLDGSLSWDSTRGGMWYSATWQDDTTFRMKGILDFDDNKSRIQLGLKQLSDHPWDKLGDDIKE